MSEFCPQHTPVLFRVSRAPVRDGNEVTAVFPCEPAGMNPAAGMSCYAIVGQHGGCSFGWYATTRPATTKEYTDIKAELESEPYNYRFKVYRRIQPWHREAFASALYRSQLV